MIQGNQIGTKLVGDGLEFADFNARSAGITLDLLRITLELIHTLLQAIDVTSQKHSLCSGLTDARLQVKDTTPDLVDIGTQGDNIEIDSVRNGVMVGEFASDMVVLPVSAIDVAILGEDV